jgi:hypothetical protein
MKITQLITGTCELDICEYFFFVAQQSKLGLDHPIFEVSRSHTHTCTSGQPITEAAAYTTHNKHKWQTCLPSAGFKSVIPTIELPQT